MNKFATPAGNSVDQNISNSFLSKMQLKKKHTKEYPCNEMIIHIFAE